MNHVLKNNDGMSLIELTFASGVLAMALSMLFGSLMTITMIARLNEDRAVANVELANVLDGVRGMTMEELMDYQAPLLSQPGTKTAVALVCYDTEGKTVPLPLVQQGNEKPDLPNPLEVKATLMWSNKKGHVFESYATILVAR